MNDIYIERERERERERKGSSEMEGRERLGSTEVDECVRQEVTSVDKRVSDKKQHRTDREWHGPTLADARDCDKENRDRC